MANKAVYPGTFDPITNGHLDLIERASRIFDELIIAVSDNISKHTLFSLDQRLELASHAARKFSNISVISFDGLLVDCARDQNATVIIRGLRAVSDFEYEFQMAGMNQQLSPQLDTLFLAASTQYTFISSSVVREIARLGGSVTDFVPDYVERALLTITGRQALPDSIEI
ncbi:MAG TPA: pantetheine-phosphate adenylyltransferase [Crenotrichaceae bacterium]|nr:pantetheine-phosphate adenylyltransferase [Crenotrichaceae bacterium]